MNERPFDALIVGAGPVGLTMTAALTQHGLRCRIIDKSPAASDKSKALVVWSRTLELLDGLGLADVFVRNGMKARGASIYGHEKRLVHLEMTGIESPFGFPLMIPQNETERLVADHLVESGVTIERNVELISFHEQPEGIRALLRHATGREESLDVPWLIGCDGAHSAVRHGLGMEFSGHADPSDWMLADVHLKGPVVADEISIFWHSEGVLAVFPIDARRFRVIANLNQPLSSPPPDPTLSDVQAMVDKRGPSGLTVSNPVWLANFRINERKVSDYRRGRVALAGDSAHIHSPAGGQGMNTGMQDAFNLAWKLALVHHGKGQAEPLLTSYSQERSAVGDQVLRGAAMLTSAATMRNPVAQWLRNCIASVVSSFGFAQDRIKNELCELSIHYRNSLLSAQLWPRLTGGLAAGERMCDAPLTSAMNGNRTTLFAAMRGIRHSLLLLPASHESDEMTQLLTIAGEAERCFPEVFETHRILKAEGATPNATGASATTWLDATGRVHEKLHAIQPTLILIRPDGYIGFRCQPADGKALLDYLSRYLIPKC